LCEDGDDAEERATHRSSGVDVRFGEALDVDASLVQLVDGVDRESLGAGESVETPHEEGVTGTEVVQAGHPLRPISASR
jgi:hypothetical protein